MTDALNAVPKKNFLIITINHSNAGFFSYVNFVLNQLIYSEEHGMIPVVFFGKDSVDGPNAYYDPDHGENTWDYYFEPVAGYTYADIEAKLADPDDPLTAADVHRLSNDELWDMLERNADNIQAYPHGVYENLIEFDTVWYEERRQRANQLIEKYIRVKPHILAKVEEYYQAYFAGVRVVGTQIRGSDKGTAQTAPKLMRIIKPAQYFPYIDKYMEEHGPCKVFVATDQVQFLEDMRNRYGSKIISLPAARSRGNLATFNVNDRQTSNYAKGEEVLIDCLLLSRCDYLLKCTSAVGEFAIYFNPALKSFDLNYLDDPWPRLTALKIKYVKRLLLLVSGYKAARQTDLRNAYRHLVRRTSALITSNKRRRPHGK